MCDNFRLARHPGPKRQQTSAQCISTGLRLLLAVTSDEAYEALLRRGLDHSRREKGPDEKPLVFAKLRQVSVYSIANPAAPRRLSDHGGVTPKQRV